MDFLLDDDQERSFKEMLICVHDLFTTESDLAELIIDKYKEATSSITELKQRVIRFAFFFSVLSFIVQS